MAFWQVPSRASVLIIRTTKPREMIIKLISSASKNRKYQLTCRGGIAYNIFQRGGILLREIFLHPKWHENENITEQHKNFLKSTPFPPLQDNGGTCFPHSRVYHPLSTSHGKAYRGNDAKCASDQAKNNRVDGWSILQPGYFTVNEDNKGNRWSKHHKAFIYIWFR